MTFPQQITSPPQAYAEVPTNENFAVLAHQAVYGNAPETSSLLVWGYYGGTWGGFAVADGTFTLAPSATTYITVKLSDGSTQASVDPTHWNDATNYARAYLVTTGTVAVTGVVDYRAGPGGAMGGAGASGGVSPLNTKGDVYVFGTAAARLPIGANAYVLTADSSQALGLKWAPSPGGGGGGGGGAGPIMRAHSTISQPISAANTPTKLLFDTVDEDSGGYFASSRYTPPPGWYRVNANLGTGATSGGYFGVQLWKNGAQYNWGNTGYPGVSGVMANMTDLVYCNGTDYLEIYVQLQIPASTNGVASTDYFAVNYVGNGGSASPGVTSAHLTTNGGGDIAIPSSGWGSVVGLTLSIPAKVGDVIKLSTSLPLVGASGNTQARWNLNGTPLDDVRYHDVGAYGVFGQQGWCYTWWRTVQAGDLSGGNFVAQLEGNANVSGIFIFNSTYSGSTQRGAISLENYVS